MAQSQAERDRNYYLRKKLGIEAVPYAVKSGKFAPVDPRPCLTCGKDFTPRLRKRKFCSPLCSNRWNQKAAIVGFKKKYEDTVLSRGRRKWKTAFYQKIWQPCVCADCGKCFETIYPIEWISLGYKNPNTDIQRCRECQSRFILANHGGGPRRRCKHFDVPYESINPLVVFNRDGWTCHLCKQPIDSSLLGKPHEEMAPEMEHKWPLSARIDDLKSPGHVLANVFAAHRICNQRKGDRIDPTSVEALIASFYPEEKIVHFIQSKRDSFPIRNKQCKICKKSFRAKCCFRYCSDECRQIGTRRVSRKKKPNRFPFFQKVFQDSCCKDCGLYFHTLYYPGLGPDGFLGNDKHTGQERCNSCRKDSERRQQKRAKCRRNHPAGCECWVGDYSLHTCLWCKTLFIPKQVRSAYCRKTCEQSSRRAKKRIQIEARIKTRKRTQTRAGDSTIPTPSPIRPVKSCAA